MILQRIVSGGQTGTDIAGLIAASHCGLATGGWIPKGWKTETVPRPMYQALFNLQETPSDGYIQRTEWNVRDSDGTLIIAKDYSSRGTQMTRSHCLALRKPLFCMAFSKSAAEGELTEYAICDWIEKKNIQILNVAGNRESVAPGIQVWATQALITIFKTLQERYTREDC